MYSCGLLHMDKQRLDDQLKFIYNSFVLIQGYRLEDLPRAMGDWDEWRERVSSATIIMMMMINEQSYSGRKDLNSQMLNQFQYYQVFFVEVSFYNSYSIYNFSAFCKHFNLEIENIFKNPPFPSTRQRNNVGHIQLIYLGLREN